MKKQNIKIDLDTQTKILLGVAFLSLFMFLIIIIISSLKTNTNSEKKQINRPKILVKHQDTVQQIITKHTDQRRQKINQTEIRSSHKKTNFLRHYKNEDFYVYIANPQTDDIKIYWENPQTGKPFDSLPNLKRYVEQHSKTLLFAINGGIYNQYRQPEGLLIINGHLIKALNTGNGTGNFYLKPNGVFILTKDRKAIILKTENFKFFNQNNIKYAIQSGPLLIFNDTINPLFSPNSVNKYVRTSVGITKDGEIVFVYTVNPVSFYQLAEFMKNSLNVTDALYLDGAVTGIFIKNSVNFFESNTKFITFITVEK